MRSLLSFGLFGMVGCLVSGIAFSDGGISSGGADLYEMEHNAAWFLDNRKPVKACLKVSASFGFTDLEVQTFVTDAAKQWDDYLVKKQIFDRWDQSFVPAHRLEWQSACDGSEDIKFVFGPKSFDEDVFSAQEKYSKPLSFANRLRYDRLEGWGKGVVWVKEYDSAEPEYADTRIKNILYSLVLHEFGHVLGVPHMSGTIMMENIAMRLKQAEDYFPSNYLKIDHQREVEICFSCNAKYTVYNVSQIAVGLLTGSNRAGTGIIEIDPATALLILTVNVDGTDHRFTVHRPYHWDMLSSVNNTVFKVVKSHPMEDDPNYIFVGGNFDVMKGYFGMIEAETGEHLQVFVTRNGLELIEIVAITDRGPEVLATAKDIELR